MQESPEIYQKYLVVEEKHLDKQRHVNNVQYVQWVQDVAEEHWETRATEKQKQDVLWVVVKHEISYKMEAFLNDKICLETYVDETTHVTSQRYVFIKNADTGKLLAKAKTTWCLLDVRTKKPVRISDEMKLVFQQ